MDCYPLSVTPHHDELGEVWSITCYCGRTYNGNISINTAVDEYAAHRVNVDRYEQLLKERADNADPVVDVRWHRRLLHPVLRRVSARDNQGGPGREPAPRHLDHATAAGSD